MCAAWIPEIYIADINEYPTKLTINRLDKKRFKLKCGLCSGKGACVECKHGKCRTAAHPWCVVNTPKGYTRRVVKDEDDELIWQIFCQTHASSVTVPLKPKPKSKIVQQLAAIALTSSDIIDKNKEKMKKNEKESSLPQLSMAHSVKKNKIITAGSSSSGSNVKKSIIEMLHAGSDLSTGSKGIGIGGKTNQKTPTSSIKGGGENILTKKIDIIPLISGKKVRGQYKKKGTTKLSSNIENSDSENDNKNSSDKDGISRRKENDLNSSAEKKYDDEKMMKSRILDLSDSYQINKEEDKIIEEMDIETEAEEINYSILTLNEWPGQSEGEAMDLDHFWNVAAMQYPEDHPATVRGLLLLL